MDRQVMICECNSLEHQIVFWYDEEDGFLWCEPHLVTRKGFLSRLWYGIKYAFGYKSCYGSWDSIIIKKEDMIKLKKCLNDKVR